MVFFYTSGANAQNAVGQMFSWTLYQWLSLVYWFQTGKGEHATTLDCFERSERPAVTLTATRMRREASRALLEACNRARDLVAVPDEEAC